MPNDSRTDPVSVLDEIVSGSAPFDELMGVMNEVIAQLNVVSGDIEFYISMDDDGDVRLQCRPTVQRPEIPMTNDGSRVLLSNGNDSGPGRPTEAPESVSYGRRHCVGYLMLHGPVFNFEGRTYEINSGDDLRRAIATSLNRQAQSVERIIAVSKINRRLAQDETLERSTGPEVEEKMAVAIKATTMSW